MLDNTIASACSAMPVEPCDALGLELHRPPFVGAHRKRFAPRGLLLAARVVFDAQIRHHRRTDAVAVQYAVDVQEDEATRLHSGYVASCQTAVNDSMCGVAGTCAGSFAGVGVAETHGG